MNNLIGLQQKRPKFRPIGLCLVMNIFGIVCVGKGVALLSTGAHAGIGWLSWGTLILLVSPWAQDGIRDEALEPPAFWFWVFIMGAFAVYAFVDMVNALI